MEQKVIHLYNDTNLGDNVFTCILFYNIKQYLEDNNIIIIYYTKMIHINQIIQFIPSKNIKIMDIKYKQGLNVWIGDRQKKTNIFNKNSSMSFNDFYVLFFREILETLKLPIDINNLEYEDIDLLDRYEKLDNKYKNLDILVLNSNAASGQFYYNNDIWEKHIREYDKRYKIATTKKINGIACTMDDKLFIKDIAAISTNCKVIIAVNTGPIVGMLNRYTLNNVNKFYIFDNNVFYSYPKFENKNKIEDINLTDLDKFIFV